MDDETGIELRTLEEALWRSETRCDQEWMARHVTDDVIEFGQSRRVYDGAAMLAAKPGEIDVVLPLPDLAVHEIGTGVALVTYRSIWTIGDEVLTANRTSLSISADDGWRLRFHQGTPAFDPLPQA